MKTFLRIVAVYLAAALSIVACDKGFEEQVEFPEGTVAFKAIVDGGADTRTVMEEGENNRHDSKWYGEESIQVSGRNGSYTFNASVLSPASSATFTYDGEFDEDEVLAVYPSGSYSADLDKRTVSSVTIPSEQNAVVGSYDPAAVPALAYSTSNTLQFRNVPALLKFTMGSSGVKNVTVWGDMTEVEVEPEEASDDKIYLSVHNDWKSDNAWFAAYFWGSNGNKWEKMTLVSGNMYSCSKTEGYPNVIFCRMNSSKQTLGWSNVWNQTVDLSYGSDNHFTVTKPWDGQDGKAEGTWSTYLPESGMTTTLGISGTGTVSYNDGEPAVSGFSTGYVSLNGDFIKGQTYYIAVAPVVFENGFTVEFSNEGDFNKYEVKSTSKRIQFKRNVVHDLGILVSGNETGFFTDPAVLNADEPCTVYYKAVEDDAVYGAKTDLYAHVWLRNGSVDSHGSEWGDNSEKYKLSRIGDNLWTMTMTPTVREWFASGTTPVQKIGIIARNEDGSKQTDDNFMSVTDDLYGIDFSLPEGAKHGINYEIEGENTVTLVLYDRDNQGKSHDFCNLLWDENWWGDSSKPKKSLAYDELSGCWWITLTDLDPDKQYKFQYQLGYGSNVSVTTFDPYTEIVYDRNNDQWISSDTYPDLAAEYGDTHYGRDNGLVSAFKINRDAYDWVVEDYDIEDKHDLVIYELLVRDFTDNAYGEGSIKAALGQLDYLKTLGVNAIELMPVQEFEGNDSWGYGNHAYFALDKAYGTRKDYKDFIDACHQNGIAVLVDVVYNHATGAHPYAAMYWDGTNNKTASNNPWFNVEAPHQFSVFQDWNHSNPLVREHIKRSLTYLMEEYKVDGFRFDLTKGFTQNSYTESSYDQSRVDYIKEYHAHIRSVDEKAVMICEHFMDDENWELGQDGILVWRNMNHSYTKAMRRNMSEADFYGTTNGFNPDGTMADWNNFGMLVGFQESHDEERTAYLGQWEDNNGPEIPFATRMERAKINAAFLLLSPGPKMIWQFGEIGYDISIEENGRVGKKPCKTAEYMAVKERKALYDTYAMLIKFRKDNPRFFDYDVNFRWYVGGNEQTGRYLFARSGEGKHFALFGNFGTGSQSIGVQLPEGVNNWYQYEDSSKIWKGSSHTTTMAEGQFYLLVSDKSMCLK